MSKREEKATNVVKRIVLDVNGKELSMTPAAARSLYEALKELVGEKEVIHRWGYNSPYIYPTVYPWTVTYLVSRSATKTSTTYGDTTGCYALNDRSGGSVTITCGDSTSASLT